MQQKKKTPKFVFSKFGIIGVVPPAETVFELKNSLALTSLATTVEIRLDKCRFGISGPPRLTDEMARIIVSFCSGTTIRPVILTFRAKEHGGTYDTPVKDQLGLWLHLPEVLRNLINYQSMPIYIDWGLDLIEHVIEINQPQIFPWSKIVVSHHFMKNTPPESELRQKLREMEATPATSGIKLVTLAKDEGDVIVLERLYKGRTDERPLIAFAMGELGQSSRIECLTTWGNAGTYAYLRGCEKNAQGMLSVEEMLAIPRVRKALGLGIPQPLARSSREED